VSIHVLDASALVAYIGGEQGGAVVASLLSDPSALCLCEVYDDSLRTAGPASALRVIATLIADGVIERRDMSRGEPVFKNGFCTQFGCDPLPPVPFLTLNDA
jgi:hypothetical protein